MVSNLYQWVSPLGTTFYNWLLPLQKLFIKMWEWIANKRRIITFKVLIVLGIVNLDADVDYFGNTKLHTAIYEENTTEVKEFIALGANVDATNRHGLTPLHIASRQGNLEFVNALILAKADVDATNREGKTPLFEAIEKGHKEIAKALIAAHADLNILYRDNTVLHLAALQGQDEIVQDLIAANVDVNVKNKNGKTPWDLARDNGHTVIANILAPLSLKSKAVPVPPNTESERIFNDEPIGNDSKTLLVNYEYQTSNSSPPENAYDKKEMEIGSTSTSKPR